MPVKAAFRLLTGTVAVLKKTCWEEWGGVLLVGYTVAAVEIRMEVPQPVR